jgi:hypothetical protein
MGATLPWNTNGKQTNRIKLLLANFRRTDRARALASGTEEGIWRKRTAARGYPVRRQ